MSDSISRKEIVSQVAERLEMSRASVERVLDLTLDGVVTEALTEGKKVNLGRFGAFSVTERSARTGRNPKTGEAIQIAASKTVKFKAYKGLSDAL